MGPEAGDFRLTNPGYAKKLKTLQHLANHEHNNMVLDSSEGIFLMHGLRVTPRKLGAGQVGAALVPFPKASLEAR